MEEIGSEASSGSSEGPNYLKDIFYVVMLIIVVSLPLVFYYLWSKMTESKCICPKNNCKKCQPKTGPDGKPLENVDCTTDTFWCNTKHDASQFLADVLKAVEWLLKNAWWLATIGVLVFSLGGLAIFYKTRRAAGGGEAGEGGGGIGDAWSTIKDAYSGKRKLERDLADMGEQFDKMERRYDTAIDGMEGKKKADPAKFTDAQQKFLDKLKTSRSNIRSQEKERKRLAERLSNGEYSSREVSELRKDIRTTMSRFEDEIRVSKEVLDAQSEVDPTSDADPQEKAAEAQEKASEASKAYSEAVRGGE